MAEQWQDPQQPPSYISTTGDVQEPVILILTGQTIHAESPDAPQLYELNRGITSLRHTTNNVELTRVERTVTGVNNDDVDAAALESEAATGEKTPHIKLRRRHILDLVHPTDGSLASKLLSTPAYYIKSKSKSTHAGNWALKKAHLRSHWQALPVKIQAATGHYGEPAYEDGGKPLFEVAKGSGKQGGSGLEWKDGETGETLAVEDCSKEENEFRLITMKAMDRKTLDAIVGLWCCRLWDESARSHAPVDDKGEGGECFNSHAVTPDVTKSIELLTWDLCIVYRSFKSARTVPNAGPLGVGRLTDVLGTT